MEIRTFISIAFLLFAAIGAAALIGAALLKFIETIWRGAD